MSFESRPSEHLQKILKKLKRKDHALFIAVKKKMHQITCCDNISINNYKNLRGNMSGSKRVHITSLVLFFKVKGNIIVFDRIVHHDDAY